VAVLLVLLLLIMLLVLLVFPLVLVMVVMVMMQVRSMMYWCCSLRASGSGGACTGRIVVHIYAGDCTDVDTICSGGWWK